MILDCDEFMKILYTKRVVVILYMRFSEHGVVVFSSIAGIPTTVSFLCMECTGM